MNSVKPLTRIYFLTTFALALLGATLRTFTMLLCFDAEIGYFQSGILPIICRILTIVAVILPIVLSIITPKDTYPQTWPTHGTPMIAIFPAAVLLVSGIIIIATQTSSPLALASGVFGVLSGIYFLLTIRPQLTTKHPQTISLLGFATVFWALSSLAETYFDLNTTMNSPVKLILQFSLLSVALAIISELRFRLNKPLPRTAVALHSIAMYFSLTSGFSILVTYLKFPGSIPLYQTLCAATLLGMSLYLATRLLIYMFVSPNEVSKTPEVDNALTIPEAPRSPTDTSEEDTP